MRPREPMEHNMCEQFHPIVWIGPHFKCPLLSGGWGFDETVGEPWPPHELTEMELQAMQIREAISTTTQWGDR